MYEDNYEELEDEKTLDDLKVPDEDRKYTHYLKEMCFPGDIVCASYGDFQGKQRVGIFLVLYSEKLDRSYTGYNTNYYVCKVTTNNLLGDSYTVRLHEGEAGLTHDCLVNLGKSHTFIKNQVYKKIGTLSPKVMTFVFKEWHRLSTEVSNQMLNTII